MNLSAIIGFITGLLLLTAPALLAQDKKDSIEKKSVVNKAFKQGAKLITTTPKDTVINQKNTDPYRNIPGKLLRTRNENLIFGTLELKATYVPSDAFGEPGFVFSFKQNLRIKNTGTFVRAPSLILYN